MPDIVEIDVPSDAPTLTLPIFASFEEEAEFWMTHDSSPYWDQMEDVTDSPPPDLKRRPPGAVSTARRRPAPDATEEITVRLAADLIDVLRAKARAADIPLDTLINTWLRERLDEEFRRAMAEVR